jgi:hypothetical protein
MIDEADTPERVPEYVWEAMSSARECPGCALYDFGSVAKHLQGTSQGEALVWLLKHRTSFTDVVLWSLDPKYCR